MIVSVCSKQKGVGGGGGGGDTFKENLGFVSNRSRPLGVLWPKTESYSHPLPVATYFNFRQKLFLCVRFSLPRRLILKFRKSDEASMPGFELETLEE